MGNWDIYKVRYMHKRSELLVDTISVSPVLLRSFGREGAKAGLETVPFPRTLLYWKPNKNIITMVAKVRVH